MTPRECPICGNAFCDFLPGSEWGYPIHDCPRCGAFAVVGTASGILPALLQNDSINRSVLSHLIRKAQRPGRPVTIYENDLPSYKKAPPLPKPREQIDNLLLWVGAKQSSPAVSARCSIPCLAATIGAAISGSGEAACQWLLNHLEDEKWIEIHPEEQPGRIALKLSMKGWNRYEQLQHTNVTSRIAFMAMQFNDATLEKVLTECFKPAVEQAGFELRALNEAQPAGLIDNQIRAAIRRARFVIADLSHDNNGAYFEAGFAEGIDLPVLYTCEHQKFEGKKTHFDTNHMVTIPWDIRNLEDAGRKLTATIRATLPGEAERGP
ncbi:MAG TPA: hypothetical protein VHY10_08170 [Xanthobacteraceae bacterium]|jgi:hypothetical protein|nr:hypothetical protein [Xanthobacteraceae bacterium]